MSDGEGYRCVAASPAAFIQQLAASYVANGYFFYVAGSVPWGKDPASVDAKLLGRYGIGVSKWVRARRRRAGLASVQYLRHGRFFLLLATHGIHPIFDEEPRIRDCRRVPIKCFGYAVSFKRGRVHVRIEREEFKTLKAALLGLAPHRSAEVLSGVFRRLPFEPYAPVRRQLLSLWRAVNRARRAAGFEPVPVTCIRMRRTLGPAFTNGSRDTVVRRPAEPGATASADGVAITTDLRHPQSVERGPLPPADRA